MGDAARSAVLLVDALDSWWCGESSEARALERYRLARDADILPMYDFTVGRLESAFEPEEWQEFGRLTWENAGLARARVAAMAHAIPPATVYSIEAVRAVLGGTVPVLE
jgi:hypothetical protein